MCGICGFWDFKGKDVSKFLLRSLLTISHRGPDGVGVYVEGKVLRSSWEDLIIPNGSLAIGHAHLAIIGEPQPIANEDGSLWLIHNGEVYNYSVMRTYLESLGHKFNYKTDSEVLIHTFESNKIDNVIGDYALALYNTKREEIQLYRDFPGIRPLFYCKENNMFAFCSERKGLRGNCEEIREVKPGHKVLISHDGVSEEQFFNPRDKWSENDIINDEAEAINELSKVIDESVATMCYKEIAVPFSGGIDSSLIAYLAQKNCNAVKLYTVGVGEAKDISNAIQAAKLLGLDIEVIKVNRYELEGLLEKTIYYIEDWDPIKVSIALPLYIAFNKIKEDGYRVAFSGQGADELFAGYARYLRSSNLSLDLEEDVFKLHKTNLNRDDHVSMANSIEVRYPYLNIEVINTAMRIHPYLKIREKIRKYILRKTAIELGLPKEIAYREKKAIQYGSKSIYNLRKLAKKRGKKLSEFLKDIYSKLFSE